MSRQIKITAETPETAMRPPIIPANRVQQIGNAALNLAEKQILEGTASSQVITYFLKAISEKERLENERLVEENKKLRAQTEAIEAAKKSEELFAEAMRAFKGYQQTDISEEGENYDGSYST